MLRKRFVWLAVAALLIVAWPAGNAGADHVDFTVDSVNDGGDEVPGDGACATFLAECTLRAAVQEANAHPGHDTIILPADTYMLTIEGHNEDAAGSGDLDITDDLTIVGDGAQTTIIDGNRADRVFDVSSDASVEMSGVTIQNGVTVYLPLEPIQGGGGIHNAGTLDLNEVAIDRNVSPAGGGIENTGTLTINDSAITNNGGTGVITRAGANLATTNVTVSNNGGNPFPDSSGVGGIRTDGVVTLNNVTVVENRAGYSVAGIYTAGSVSIKNSIVTENLGANCGGGVLTSTAYNLEDTNTCGFSAATDLPNTDPLLGPLADNGGPTMTHALLANSPAIDAGSPDCPPPATDQRGVQRSQRDACDIGAYELEGAGRGYRTQLGECLAVTNIAYGRDNQADIWLAFEPGGPPALQTLTEFVPFGGYYVHTSADCTISSGINVIDLYAGWNLIGWRED